MRGSRGANAAKDGSMQIRMSSLYPSLTLTHDLFDPRPTAKPKPCHNRERDTAISQTSSVHIKRGGGGGLQNHSNPSQHTALHSQAINGTLERGCLGEEGMGGGGCLGQS